MNLQSTCRRPPSFGRITSLNEGMVALSAENCRAIKVVTRLLLWVSYHKIIPLIRCVLVNDSLNIIVRSHAFLCEAQSDSSYITAYALYACLLGQRLLWITIHHGSALSTTVCHWTMGGVLQHSDGAPSQDIHLEGDQRGKPIRISSALLPCSGSG